MCKFCLRLGDWCDFELVSFENEAANRKTKTYNHNCIGFVHVGLVVAENGAPFFPSDIYATSSTAFNRGRHLYSEGGQHVKHRPAF